MSSSSGGLNDQFMMLRSKSVRAQIVVGTSERGIKNASAEFGGQLFLSRRALDTGLESCVYEIKSKPTNCEQGTATGYTIVRPRSRHDCFSFICRRRCWRIDEFIQFRRSGTPGEFKQRGFTVGPVRAIAGRYFINQSGANQKVHQQT